MWDNVLGHTQVKEFLANYLTREERPHALLFSGSEGIGKRKLALEFARTLLCPKHSEGDGCASCRLMNFADGNLGHPDFIYIRREEDQKTHRLKDLSIDQMRDLLSKSVFAPVMSPNKVCIIEDVDRMGEPAANSFLKLLEEPPAGWVFILIATSADRLLTTILSRVVHLRLHGIPLDKEISFLQKYSCLKAKELGICEKIPQEQLAALASMSEGSIGLAISYYESNLLLYREQAYAFLEALPLQNPLLYLVGRPWLEKYERPEALMFVQLLQLLLRDLLVCKLQLKQSLYNCDLKTELYIIDDKWSVKSLKKALAVINDTYIALVTNVGVKLALETMAIKIDKICKE